MDISMPEMDGLEATRQVKLRWPAINVLMLTMHRSDEYFFEALKVGASGYILKAADTDELVNAVRVVGQGEVFLYPSMAKKLLDDYLRRLDAGVRSIAAQPAGRIAPAGVDTAIRKLPLARRSLSTVHTHRATTQWVGAASTSWCSRLRRPHDLATLFWRFLQHNLAFSTIPRTRRCH
jgi:CheY-like chemotaxis protein